MENQNEPLQETQSTPQSNPDKKSYLPVILIILGIIGIISSLSILYRIIYTINLFSGFPSDLFASILFYLVSIVPITIPVAQIIFGFRLRQTQNASKIISHRQKTIAILLILSSFVFALLFKILYVDFFTVSISNHNLPPPSIPSPTPAPDPTADWQTYRNDEYGFELRHPKDFKPTHRDPYLTALLSDEQVLAEKQCNEAQRELVEEGESFGAGSCLFGIFISQKTQDALMRLYSFDMKNHINHWTMQRWWNFIANMKNLVLQLQSLLSLGVVYLF